MLPVDRIHASLGKVGNDSEQSNGTTLECVWSGCCVALFFLTELDSLSSADLNKLVIGRRLVSPLGAVSGSFE